MTISSSLLLESLVFILAGAACAIPLIYLNVRWALRLGFIDWPKARGVTEEQIPIVGHSLIVVSIVAIAVMMRYYPISPWFLTTAMIMAVMGYFDDRRPLPAVDKIFFQLFCSTAVVFLDPLIREAITSRFGLVGAAWTVFFMVGLINAINFIDGIDGLAGIVIAAGSLGYIFLSVPFPEQYPYFLYASVVLGMMVPFLYVNVLKRKGFLGNVGSYFFSYVLAVMHVSLPIDTNGPVSRLAISGLCFLIPIADACMVVVARMMTLRSPFNADKGHLHHRLVQTALKLRYILFFFGLMEALAVMVSVTIAEHPGARNSLLPTVIGMSQLLLATALILLVEKASRLRVQTYFQRLDTGAPIYFIKYQLARADGGPISTHSLRRIEAKVSAEIRITDLCFVQPPNTLFITLKTIPEPLKGISGRIEGVLQSEKVATHMVVEQGEFVKVPKAAKPNLRLSSRKSA